MTSGVSIIPNWVVRDTDLDAHELLVYMALLSHADGSGVAWPSLATIAKESRTSPSTVKRTLPKLQKRGMIEIIRRKNDKVNISNLYRVSFFAKDKVSFREVGHREPTVGPDRTNPRSVVVHEEEPIEEEPIEEESGSISQSSANDLSFFTPSMASEKQIDYLGELHIHLNNEVASLERQGQWEQLTMAEAAELIDRYLREMPRSSDYQGPQPGDETFDQLSARGQEMAEMGFVP